MNGRINLSEGLSQLRSLGEPFGCYGSLEMAAAKSAQEVRRRFVGWLRWFMAEYPDRVASDADLARKLHISGAAVSYLLRKDSKRLPRLETVVAACELTEFTADTLLFREPPKPREQ